MILHLETTLDENNTIHLPAEIAERLKRGDILQLRLSNAEHKNAKAKLWQSIVEVMDAHIAQGTVGDGKPYQWNREELYDHLDKYYG